MAIMRYVELQPPPPLRPFVACFWILEGPGDPKAASQPIFPDGRAELIVHYGDRFSRALRHGAERQPRGLLVGQMGRAMYLREGRRVGIVAARLAPAGIGALLRGDASEITDRIVDVSGLAGPVGVRLVEEINEGRTDRERVTALESFLLSRLRPEDAPDPRIEATARILQARGGLARVDDLARTVALSPRQLRRRFVESVGLAPKVYARIVRFQRAVAALGAGRSLTDTAVRFGYYDHAHFTRDFREIAGTSPSGFLRDRSPLTDHFIDDPSDSYKTTAEHTR